MSYFQKELAQFVFWLTKVNDNYALFLKGIERNGHRLETY